MGNNINLIKKLSNGDNSSVLDNESKFDGSSSESKSKAKSSSNKIKKLFFSKSKLKSKFQIKKSKSKSKLKSKSKPKIFKNDEFFLQYLQLNENVIDDIDLFDQRRVIFISLIGLFETWTKCPPVVLYSSIFMLPLSRNWVYNPIHHQNELKNEFVGQYMYFYEDSVKFLTFIELLKWKDSQGLIFWMNDKFDYRLTELQDNKLINPFWCYVSSKLVKLYNPITKQKYEALKFNENWWRNTYNEQFHTISKYKISLSYILSEYYFLTMKFLPIQELLYQSNPNSFNVLIYYNKDSLNRIDRMHRTTSICTMFANENKNKIKYNLNNDNNDEDEENKYDDDNNDNDNDTGNEIENHQSHKPDIDDIVDNYQIGNEWFISMDYDPYDMDDEEEENTKNNDED